MEASRGQTALRRSGNRRLNSSIKAAGEATCDRFGHTLSPRACLAARFFLATARGSGRDKDRLDDGGGGGGGGGVCARTPDGALDAGGYIMERWSASRGETSCCGGGGAGGATTHTVLGSR